MVLPPRAQKSQHTLFLTDTRLTNTPLRSHRPLSAHVTLDLVALAPTHTRHTWADPRVTMNRTTRHTGLPGGRRKHRAPCTAASDTAGDGGTGVSPRHFGLSLSRAERKAPRTTPKRATSTPLHVVAWSGAGVVRASWQAGWLGQGRGWSGGHHITVWSLTAGQRWERASAHNVPGPSRNCAYHRGGSQTPSRSLGTWPTPVPQAPYPSLPPLPHTPTPPPSQQLPPVVPLSWHSAPRPARSPMLVEAPRIFWCARAARRTIITCTCSRPFTYNTYGLISESESKQHSHT